MWRVKIAKWLAFRSSSRNPDLSTDSFLGFSDVMDMSRYANDDDGVAASASITSLSLLSPSPPRIIDRDTRSVVTHEQRLTVVEGECCMGAASWFVAQYITWA